MENSCRYIFLGKVATEMKSAAPRKSEEPQMHSRFNAASPQASPTNYPSQLEGSLATLANVPG